MFLVRRTLFLMGLGLVALILALNTSARHREASYGLIVMKYDGSTMADYSLYEMEFPSFRMDIIAHKTSSESLGLGVSPNQQWLAYSALDEQGNTQIYVTGRNIQPHQITFGQRSQWLSWGKDSQTLYYAPTNNFILMQVQRNGTNHRRLTQETIGSLYITPNGQWLVYTRYEPEFDRSRASLFRMKPTDGDPLKVADNVISNVFHLTDNWIYYGGLNNTLHRANLTGIYDQELVASQEYAVPVLNLTSDARFGVLGIGEHWYITGGDASVIFDLTTQYKTTRFIEFSPDEKWVIFISDTGTYRCYIDGTQLQRITPYEINKIAWSPDGQWTYFGVEESIFRLNWKTLALEKILAQTDTHVVSNISPDGNWLIISNQGPPFSYYKIQVNGSNLESLPTTVTPLAWIITPEYSYHSLRCLTLGFLLIGGMPMLKGIARGLRSIQRFIG